MFALVLASASVVDEHAFDGVIQFDALQSSIPAIPGTPVGPVAATTTISYCIASTGCNDATANAALFAAISALTGIATTSISTSCGASCTLPSRGRGLLQFSGVLKALILSGATTAQLQLLQNNIVAGNLISVGLGTSVVVPGATVFAPGTPTINAVPLVALNPLSVATTTCVTNTVKLPCVGASTTVTAIQACASTSATILAANGIVTVCCACTNGFQVTPVSSTVTLSQLCNGVSNVRGCGKSGSKKGLLGLLGLLGLIPLLLCLLICCLCCLRRKRRGQAMLFSQTAVPAPIPAPLPHLHAEPVVLAPGPEFHVHP